MELGVNCDGFRRVGLLERIRERDKPCPLFVRRVNCGKHRGARFDAEAQFGQVAKKARVAVLVGQAPRKHVSVEEVPFGFLPGPANRTVLQ